MSAPHTDTEKQEKRHRVPLIGLGAVIAWAVLLLVLLIGWVTYQGSEPEGAEVQLETGTGQVEPAEE